MSDTRDDVTVSGAWQDLYVLTGITPAVTIIVENKGSDTILLAEGVEPLATSFKGMTLGSGQFAQIDGNPTNIWAKSCNGYSCPLFIEEA